MIYMVIPLNADESHITELERRIDVLSDKSQTLVPVDTYLEYKPEAYFVNYQGTSQELAKLIGYGSTQESIGSGMVVSLNNYYGFANHTLWNWVGVYNG